jgi:hypothetical protein
LILSLIAGVLILIGGIVWFVNPNFYSLNSSLGDFSFGVANYIRGGIAMLFAIVVLIGAYYVYLPGGYEIIGGIMVALFSIVSIATGGGFIVGTLLGLIGGVLSIFRTREPVEEAVIKPKDEEEHEKF